VVVEYVQPAGGTGWQPERRHLWARWIDDLAVEQVDTDGDGTLETILYPITDLLGSVQLLTDDTGAIAERITYDPDGTPHFWSADTVRPGVTRIAWTGDGTLPTGGTVTAEAFEIGLSEPIDPASTTNATATLTPDGGSAMTLTLTLAEDGRTAYLSGATVQAGTPYTLHIDGLTDTTGNTLWPEDATLTIADTDTYEVLADTRPPRLLAVLDGSDSLYLLLDEPVRASAGHDLSDALTLTRQGQAVGGAATRVTANLLEWHPTGDTTLIPGATYTITLANLTDLAGNAASAGVTFTHLTTTNQMLRLAYQAPTDSQPREQSDYGLTTLFQGRTWHADLGMYYYRARWYLPEAGVFGERDPVGYAQTPNLYGYMDEDPANLLDPMGRQFGPYGGFNSEPENRELSRRYKSGEVPREIERFLGDALDVVVSLRDGDFTKAVDFVARYRFDVDPDNARRSWGVVRRLAGGVPYEGFAVGDNLQVFDRGDAGYVAAIYTFDTTHDWGLVQSGKEPKVGNSKSGLPVYGPTGFQGTEFSGGVAYDYAVNRNRNENNIDVTSEVLTHRWEGYFNEFSLSLPIPGFVLGPGISGFRSNEFAGASEGVGVGAGISLTHTFYHRGVGPMRFSSLAEIGHALKLYWQGRHLRAWVRDGMKDLGLLK